MSIESSSIGVNNAVNIFETLTNEAKKENDKLRSFEFYQSTALIKTNFKSARLWSRCESFQLDDETVVTADETVTDANDSFSLSSLHSVRMGNYKFGRRDSDFFETIESDCEDNASFSYDKEDIFIESFSSNIQDWKVLCILGEGAFGTVAQVQQRLPKSTTNKKRNCYALKVMSKYQILCDGLIDEIITEKKMMREANSHPFIVKLRSAWQDSNFVYLLQDFVQGGELYSLMRNQDNELTVHSGRCPSRRAFPEYQVQFYAACIADALYYLHHICSIVYRDLKPENILIDSEGYPVIVDLGLAKMLSIDYDFKTRTFCGTPNYVSPEQINGMDYSFGVDNWALGVLTYEMLTGLHPFDDWDSRNEMALYNSIVSDDYRPIPPEFESVSLSARDFIDQMLVKDPGCRLGSTTQINNNYTSAIQDHPWLSGIDINELLERNIPAPWIPKLKNLNDSTMFDHCKHSTGTANELFDTKFVTPLTAKEQEKFAAFDFE